MTSFAGPAMASTTLGCDVASRPDRTSAIFGTQEILRTGGNRLFPRSFFRSASRGDPSQGTGVVYSLTASDRRGGFEDNDTTLLRATLPGLSLAMKAHAGHVIASALLRTYLGEQTGQRVHAGAIERGSVESLHAVLWFADIRGFTPMSDASPGPIVIELLNDVFEVIAATLRSRGGEVLKFLGDGVLLALETTNVPPPLSFNQADRARTCDYALDAAVETMRRPEVLNATRAEAGLPTPQPLTWPCILERCSMAQCRRHRPARLPRLLALPSTKLRASKRCASRCVTLYTMEFAAALGKADDRFYITRSSSTARRTGGEEIPRSGTELRTMTLASFNVRFRSPRELASMLHREHICIEIGNPLLTLLRDLEGSV